MACAVLGPKGTFSEEAARLYWGEENKITTAGSIPELFLMLIRNEIDDVLVPIDNSHAGSIDITMECLSRYPVCIKGEVIIPIEQHLMAVQQYELDEIELLISQPIALIQCCDFIDSNLGDIRTEIAVSTSRALELLNAEKRKAAAIGSRNAAQVYGLEIIYENIENTYNNTRFVHLGREELLSYEGQKCSIIFSLTDYPGALHKVLGIFAVRNLNLSKIESRRNRRYKDSFSFYIEVDCQGSNVSIKNVLQELKYYCNEVKYLGSYNKQTEA